MYGRRKIQSHIILMFTTSADMAISILSVTIRRYSRKTDLISSLLQQHWRTILTETSSVRRWESHQPDSTFRPIIFLRSATVLLRVPNWCLLSGVTLPQNILTE